MAKFEFLPEAVAPRDAQLVAQKRLIGQNQSHLRDTTCLPFPACHSDTCLTYCNYNEFHFTPRRDPLARKVLKHKVGEAKTVGDFTDSVMRSDCSHF